MTGVKGGASPRGPGGSEEVKVDLELERALELARGAAAEAGALLMRGQRRGFSVQKKGAIDLVTEYDRRAEELVVGAIRGAFPRHAVVAEEGSGCAGEAGQPTWYVDPLDGTTNFAHLLPIFAVSIALEVEGRGELGVIYLPALGWEFVARRGQGAWLNPDPGGRLGGPESARLGVSATADLGAALVGTGFPYDRRTSSDNNLHRVSRILPLSQGLRRLGSAALDCAMVAWGRLDAYWEAKINAWDVAAGALMVQEAGGRVSDLEGRPLDLEGRRILCTNGHLHGQLVRLLAGT